MRLKLSKPWLAMALELKAANENKQKLSTKKQNQLLLPQYYLH